MDVKLVITSGSRKKQVVRLRGDETIVGRQHGCDLRIPSPDVSRRHCRLAIRGDCLVVEDLASSNGSFINGVRIEGEELLRPGDVLAVGPISFRVEYALTTSALQQLVPEAPMVPAIVEDVEVAEVAAVEAEVPLLEEDVRPAQPAVLDAVVMEEDEESVPTAEAADQKTINLDDLAWKAPDNANIHDLLSQLGDEQ
jgi:pSer/pThr/pTyr-binding forkhead associated (FHA) protein